ncbi:MAG: hypothetical protein AB7S38_01330 [Vulcanimicrobiota bacterium]
MAKNKQGIALFIAIVVVTVLTILAVSFVALNRQHLRLLSVSDAHLKAEQATRSGVEYARMRLDSDPAWGTPSGTNQALAEVVNMPGMVVFEGERDGVYQVVGVLAGGQSSFQYHFQLSGTDLVAFQAFTEASIEAAPGNPNAWQTVDVAANMSSVNHMVAGLAGGALQVPRTSGRALPGGCSNLIVMGGCQQASQVLDTTLKRAFIVDASALSAGHLVVATSGEGTWQIRSLDPTVNKVRARQDIVAPAPSKVDFGTDPGSGEAVSTADILVSASAVLDSDGHVMSVSGSSLGTNPALKNSAEAAAHGIFTPNSTGNYDPPALTADQLRAAPGGTATMASGLYHFVDPTTVHYFSSPTANPSGTPDAVYTDTIPDTSGAGTAAHLKDRKFMVSGNVEVGGALTISGETGSRASLALGYEADGSLGPDSRGRLKVDGDVRIQGETVGQGTLIAQDSGDVTLEGNSALSASPTAGVAVFAEGSVTMEPVPGWVGGASTAEVDWEFYRQALEQSSANTAWQYGAGSPNLDLDMAGSWSGPERAAFAKGDDQQINPSAEPRDQLLITSSSDANYQMLMDLATEFDVYNNNEMTYKDYDDGNGLVPTGYGIKDLFDGAVNNYLAGKYDNYPFGTNTFAADPGITLARYERLKDFLVNSQNDMANAHGAYYGNIRVDNLPDGFDNNRIARVIDDKMAVYISEALLGGRTLSQYFSGPNPYAAVGQDPRDIDFKGLIYSRNNLFIKANNHNFKVQGGLVAAGGDLVIQGATGVNFTYDPAFLDTVLNTLASGDVSRIQVVYYARR